MTPFKIKICGVTRTEDVQMIRDCGADAIGINLVPTSPRVVSLARARELTQLAQRLAMRAVVVVMNPSSDAIAAIVDQVAPDVLQLHGQELPAVLGKISTPIPLVKAISWSGREEERGLALAWQQGGWPSSEFAFLVDAYAPVAGGGTGKVARWDLLQPRPDLLSHVPLLLAGGLTAMNVAQGIAATRCAGVDTASGVESSPGIKERALVEAFVAQAEAALTNSPIDAASGDH